MNGDVGPDHYVQVVNSCCEIHKRQPMSRRSDQQFFHAEPLFEAHDGWPSSYRYLLIGGDQPDMSAFSRSDSAGGVENG